MRSLAFSTIEPFFAEPVPPPVNAANSANSDSPNAVVTLAELGESGSAATTNRAMTFDAKKLFTFTPEELPLRFAFRFANNAPTVLRPMVSAFDASTGTFVLVAQRRYYPTFSKLTVYEGENVMETGFDVFVTATNRYRNTSRPARLRIREVFVLPPTRVTANRFPQLVQLNEETQEVLIELSQYFRDPQDRPLDFRIDGPSDSQSFTYDPDTQMLQILATNTTRTYTMTITVSNGHPKKQLVVPLRVEEEAVAPPIVVQAFPPILQLSKTTAQAVFNLEDHIKDAPENALLKATKTSQILSFTVSTTPQDARTALLLEGSKLTIKTENKQQLYTVNIAATNASRKTLRTAFQVQDNKAVDCAVGPWSAWSACSAQCGGGTQTRSRPITTQPQHGGAQCPALQESQSCNTQTCRVDCAFTTTFGPCNASCGHGTQSVTYNITRWPQGGGTQCPQNTTQGCWAGHCPPPPPPPPPANPPLPNGSYLMNGSCNSCNFNGSTLCCNCRRIDGSWMHSCASWCGSYHNINGQLMC